MPLYLCRWENGDCSFVWAGNKWEAIQHLDEIANAEGFPIIALRDFMAHFRLTDTGELEFEGFGERTEDAVFERSYPVLDKALLDAPREETGSPTPEGTAMIQAAVTEERKRVRPKKIKDPQTELGKRIKRMTDAPTRIIDRTIRESAGKVLKDFKGRGRPT